MKATLIGVGACLFCTVLATVFGHFAGVDPARILVGLLLIEFYKDKAAREGK